MWVEEKNGRRCLKKKESPAATHPSSSLQVLMDSPNLGSTTQHYRSDSAAVGKTEQPTRKMQNKKQQLEKLENHL